MTATKRQALLGLWQQQVQAWAQNGELVSAAVHALGLGKEPLALTALAEALAQGDFSGLPTVELMADDELPGARSHFSESSQTVFLNTSWLAGSDQDAVLHELTLRWGEHLDVLLNTSDTPGDEGSHFAALLSAGLATPPK
ncbi:MULTISPECIES: hypothetical protein [Cyanobium]|jgi:hypothetical protein|uniref:Uncharacterized protein n=1 Tax=Cyanobium usitatum str. Tous TaxID=2116684 RepID=A0A2P7MVL4_9CYAN|nr:MULTISPECIES: hypothetical protein [Cyanobium]MCP9780559.1 hypothetical protein [Cyanobium sp. To12R1]MDH4405917.1 hypothetical protein [Cyanobium sp. D14.bin.5]PSJ05235.1 hypothetical protein C7K55_07870 [Cyanobium usitatum str. Tous]